MKLYYKYEKYDCTVKTEMKKNMWYNHEPVKLKVTMPLTDYFKILTDINDCHKQFHFRLLINDKDEHDCESFIGEGLWSIDSVVYRSTISSRFSDGLVNVIFKLGIFSSDKESKSEMRDLIINDLFKSEKGE